MSEWTDFGVSEGMSISARSPIQEMPEAAQLFSAFLAETDAALAEPFHVRVARSIHRQASRVPGH